MKNVMKQKVRKIMTCRIPIGVIKLIMTLQLSEYIH